MRSSRALTTLLSLTVAVFAASASYSPFTTRAAAQAPGGGVSPAQAAPYLGDWTASLNSPLGPGTYSIAVKVEDGKVVATVSGGMFPAAAASEISLSGKNLLLKYSSSFQGMTIPGVLALTPQGSDMLVTMSLLDGQVEMAGKAVKGTVAAAAAPAQGGRGAGA